MVSNDIADLNGSLYKTDIDLAEINLFEGSSDFLLHFAYACCVIFIIIGIPGNFITIIAFAICEKFRNATAYFIINLHINNLVYCCMILPMTAVIFSTKHWSFGITMCSVFPFMKYVLVGSAHFNIVAISFNRYIIVCHPHIYHKLASSFPFLVDVICLDHPLAGFYSTNEKKWVGDMYILNPPIHGLYKRSILIATLLFIWITPIVMFLPTFFKIWGKFDLEPKGGSCTIVPDINNRSPKTFYICFAFVGSYLTIIICYARIWWAVRKVVKNQHAYKARTFPATSSSEPDYSSANKEATHEFVSNENSTPNNVNALINCIESPNCQNNVVVRNQPSFLLRRKNNELRLPTRKDKKLATMIVAILVSFILCHLPLMMTRVLYGDYKSDPKVNILAHLTEYSAAFISPIIYVMMSKEYRQIYGLLLRLIKQKLTTTN